MKNITDKQREGVKMICQKCGSSNIEKVSASCADALASGKGFRTEDYYGDGSKFVAVGVHHDIYECQECGDQDAEPCIHD